MVDHSDIRISSRFPLRLPGGWRARLAAVRWILITAGILMLVLALANRLSQWEALIGFIAVALVAFTVPFRVEERRHHAEVTQASEQSFDIAVSRFVDALSWPCIVIDERNLVHQANAEALHRFPKLEAGRPLAFALRNPALLRGLEMCRETGRAQAVQLQLSQPNAAWYEATLAPLSTATPDSAADRDWLVIALSDVTAQNRAQAMRADFVANASHELRTPLTSLIGFIDTLQGPAANDRDAREKFLGIMRSQAERMARLVNDLLSLSRIEAHQHLSPTGTLDLVSLTNEVIEGIAPLAEAQGVKIETDIGLDAARVSGERNELYEVVENLIDNALKYGGEGGRIAVNLGPASRPGFDFQLTVTDSGPGIAAEHVPRLTERFYRIDVESSRQKKGTGLGLAIVKHVVNRHRGLLTIRSQLGVGTTVEVLLPSAREG